MIKAQVLWWKAPKKINKSKWKYKVNCKFNVNFIKKRIFDKDRMAKFKNSILVFCLFGSLISWFKWQKIMFWAHYLIKLYIILVTAMTNIDGNMHLDLLFQKALR